MKTYFDCIPCFVRQTLDSARRVTDDEAVHEELLRRVLRAISEMDLRDPPPAMGHKIHRLVREFVGDRDPYLELKDESNRVALELYPELQSRVETSSHPLEMAARLAIAGNIMDVAVKGAEDGFDVSGAVEEAVSGPFDADVDGFAKAISEAESILYLADNAGEIVLDRLLIEQIPVGKVTVAVRGGAVINDATMRDAQAAGLTDLVEVIDNGTDAPGTILNECSQEFRRRFHEAGLVIAKGQGNYETLSETQKDIYFLLKVKCPVIGEDIGAKTGSIILRRSEYGARLRGTAHR